MSDTTKLARPYAAAVFELALDQGNIADWSTTLSMLAEVTTLPPIQKLLANPNVASDGLADVILEIVGRDVSLEVKNFVRLLASNHRLPQMPEIVRLFDIKKSAQEKTMKVTLTSAVPLEKIFIEKLGKQLSQKFDKQAVLDCEIDESLIGGLLIRTGDMVIDGSIRGELSRLKEALMG